MSLSLSLSLANSINGIEAAYDNTHAHIHMYVVYCVSHRGWYARELLDNGIKKSKSGHDAGDHPPITPMRAAQDHELGGDEWLVYELITRHFLASVSPACKFIKTKAIFSINNERFKCSGKQVVSTGFTAILPNHTVKDKIVPDMDASKGSWKLHHVQVAQGATAPPDYLTESELISLVCFARSYHPMFSQSQSLISL
jgi:DNA topoisomerase III